MAMDLERLAAEATQHQRQAQDVQNQIQSLNTVEAEINKTTEALQNLSEKKTSLFNIGSGVFVKGELKEVDKVMLNIGSNIFVQKDVKSSIEFLEVKKKELTEARSELVKALQNISSRLKEIDTQARVMVKQQQMGGQQ